ncbi:hypothetical protein Q3G72_017403 [Acer saccharum]|nr:hypothetical protein Q3G72_017403 [Acer saccharum]
MSHIKQWFRWAKQAFVKTVEIDKDVKLILWKLHETKSYMKLSWFVGLQGKEECDVNCERHENDFLDIFLNDQSADISKLLPNICLLQSF